MTRANLETRRPDIDRAFRHLAGAATPAADPIAAMRAFVDRYGDVEPRAPLTGVEARPVSAAGVRCQWLIPDRIATDARLVFLHGGGWVAGGLESHRPIAARLAVLTGAATLLVDYRLAPEHPFPAALDDSAGVLAWAAANDPEGPSAARRLWLAGDSAGANLAAAITLAALESGARRPDRLVLIGLPADGRSDPRRGDRPDIVSGNAELQGVMAAYVQGAAPLDDARISPIIGREALLARFPPTLLQVSGAEFLLWDSRMFAERLIGAGARAVLSVWPAMPHVWHAFLSLLPEASEALAEAAAFLVAGDRGA